MSPDAERIETALRALEVILQREPAWREDYVASRAAFFGAAPGDLEPSARRRHLEWYLFERSRPGDTRLVLDALLDEHGAEAGLDGVGVAQCLRNSHVGVFEVASVEPDSGLWVLDIASGGEFPLQEPEASRVLEVGDVLAGRLYALGSGAHHASPGAAFFRNAPLRDALRTDMDRARGSRRGVVRISQREIESMFFEQAGAPGRPGRIGDPLQDARALLMSGGASAEEVERWFAQLALEELDPGNLLPGQEDVLGEILDQIAFESELEIETARRALLMAWHALSRDGVGRGPSVRPPGAFPSAAEARPGQAPPRAGRTGRGAPLPDVEHAIAEFERKKRAGAPMEDLFRDLERDLALDPDADPDPDEIAPAPDFPGVVGAMVEEFVWDSSRGSRAHAVDAAPLRAFAHFAREVGVFENLGHREVLRYACWWALENDEVRNADEARALLAALSEFCRWSQEQHDLPLHTDLTASFATLRTSLPRVAEANRRRTRVSDLAAGELYECLTVEGSRVRLIARTGLESDATVEESLAEWLRAGDRLRARLHEDGRLAVYCCFPPESGELSAP